jgi:hypothetical protein
MPEVSWRSFGIMWRSFVSGERGLTGAGAQIREMRAITAAEYAAQAIHIYGDIRVFPGVDGSAFQWFPNRPKDENP